MIELKFVSSIAERDIDLLVVEELSVNEEFREWFAARVAGEPSYKSNLGTWHSLSDVLLGESDIVFLFEALSGARSAVLIENKIGAPPQPAQGARYTLRGEKGIQDGYWETFKTCVIAPQKYLLSSKHTESYEVEISYEELLAFFQSRGPREQRYRYKAKILLEGIEQNRRGYQPEYSEPMTNFVREYFAFCSTDHQFLRMQEAKPRPAGSTWIMFHPARLPNGVDLVHQLTAGFVKAFFNGRIDDLDAITGKYASVLPPTASIESAGKSVAIVIPVAKIDPINVSFSEQQESVSQALSGLSRLASLLSD